MFPVAGEPLCPEQRHPPGVRAAKKPACRGHLAPLWVSCIGSHTGHTIVSYEKLQGPTRVIDRSRGRKPRCREARPGKHCLICGHTYTSEGRQTFGSTWTGCCRIETREPAGRPAVGKLAVEARRPDFRRIQSTQSILCLPTIGICRVPSSPEDCCEPNDESNDGSRRMQRPSVVPSSLEVELNWLAQLPHSRQVSKTRRKAKRRTITYIPHITQLRLPTGRT